MEFRSFARDGRPQIRYYLYPGEGGPLVAACHAFAASTDGIPVSAPEYADLSIAPRLRTKISPAELEAPRLGVLIFHPSLLPRRRGPDAVRQAIAGGDPFTGVTWFWASDDLDAGDIAEQQLVAIPEGIAPGQLYRELLVPAGLEAFRRLWRQLLSGYIRRVPQDHQAATYESWLEPDGRAGIPSPS